MSLYFIVCTLYKAYNGNVTVKLGLESQIFKIHGQTEFFGTKV